MQEGEQQRKQKHRESVKRAEELVVSNMEGRDASHDASHAYRVRYLALSLAREEGLADPSSPHYSPHALLVVELAALLHDIGDYKYTKNLEEDTVIVEKFLEEEGLVMAQKKRYWLSSRAWEKNYFAELLKKISKIQKSNGQSFVVLREK